VSQATSGMARAAIGTSRRMRRSGRLGRDGGDAIDASAMAR
jgi:hypothetical protein